MGADNALSAIEIVFLLVQVHAAAQASRCAGLLPQQLCNHLSHLHRASQSHVNVRNFHEDKQEQRLEVNMLGCQRRERTVPPLPRNVQ